MLSMQKCRLRSGLTQSELGKMVGVAQRTIAAYEVGTRKPSPAVFKRLMDVFGLTLEEAWEMFYGDDEGKEGDE